MRIGFDARTIDWTGIGTYARNLLLHMAELDVDMVIFSADHTKELIPSAERFSLVPANHSPITRQGQRAFAALVGRTNVDLLHVPYSLASAPSGLPLVVTVHDVIPLFYPRSLRGPLARLTYRRALENTLRQARWIITVSQITSSTLSMYAGVDPTKVQVIHNGVSGQFRPVEDPERLEAVRRSYGLPPHFVFWIGEFSARKNLEFLVAAWEVLLRQLPEPVPLVLAGSQEGDYEKIRREAEHRGLADMVIFPGFLREADLAAVYSAADAFVFPSLYEGFGLPPLEAMASGTPCVVSNSSSLPEVTGRAALMFNPTSQEQLVDCMLRMLTQPELRERLRNEGLRQSALFSWQRAAEETLEVYRRTLADE